MTIIEEWAKNVVETRFDKFDRKVIERAKQRIIDIVGCMMGGANAPGNPELVELVKEWGGKEEASVLIHGARVPTHNAAMVNSIMARSYDYGVMSPLVDGKRFVAHISETTVPTAITVAEYKHASGKELITAMVLGDDIAARLCAASIPSLGAWCNTGTVNKFGATAIASKLCELDERQLLNSFGIVVNQMAGSMQCVRDGTHAFKLHQGLSARDGIIATELAEIGWTGINDPLFSEFGYFALYCKDSNQEILTKKLGEEFYADAIFKPYPCCRAMQPAIDCALELVRKHDIDVRDIDEVTVRVSNSSGLKANFEIGAFPQCTANFSPLYAVASVLLRKNVNPDYYTEKYIMEPEIINFITNKFKSEVIPTERLPSDRVLAAEAKEVTVRMKDGREFSATTASAKGDAIEKPLSVEEIEEKYRTNVAFSKTVKEDNAEEALDMLKHLEEVDDIKEVVRLLLA